MASYTATDAGNGERNGITPHIILYTNHGCPFAHRAHIALKELGLPYEEVIIDLDTPREPWYLEINPRGLVPSIKYSNGLLENEIITESAIVAQFLADSRPSHLLPGTMHDPYSPLFRARLAFFVDTWNNKVQSFMYPMMKASGPEKESKVDECLAAMEKEIEPLLKDTSQEKPFFGGKDEMTLAECIVAPFLLRFMAFSQDGELLPKRFKEKVDAMPKLGAWAKAMLAKESVTFIWDEERVVQRTKKRVAKMVADQK